MPGTPTPGRNAFFAELADMRKAITALQRPVFKTVTALPAGPVDGQIIDYIASEPVGEIWRFKYRAASSSPYKWEFIGGSPQTAATGVTAVAVAGGSTYALVSGGPSITVPLAGDYIYQFGVDVINTGTSVADAVTVAVQAGAGPPNDGQAIYYAHPAAAVAQQASISRFQRITGLTTGEVLAHAAKSVNGADVLSVRWINVIPIRVGPV